MTKIKIESWKGKKVYVARRYGGQIETWKYVKGSGLTQHSARDLYRNYGSFTNLYYKKTRRFGSGIIESSKLYKKPENVPRKPKISGRLLTRQYVIGTADVYPDGIWGRSDKIRTTSGKDMDRARKQAQHRFYSLLDRHYTGRYDEDEGIEIAEQNKLHILQGYVFYHYSGNKPRVRRSTRR